LIFPLDISMFGTINPSSYTKIILGAFVATANIMLKSVLDHAVQTDYSGERLRWVSKK
jgi:hypothetical protein